jgi:hypothetical protein
MVNYAVCSFTRFFITGRENTNVILTNSFLFKDVCTINCSKKE